MVASGTTTEESQLEIATLIFTNQQILIVNRGTHPYLYDSCQQLYFC